MQEAASSTWGRLYKQTTTKSPPRGFTDLPLYPHRAPPSHPSRFFFSVGCAPVRILPDATIAMPGWKYAFSLPGSAVKAATPPGTVRLIGMASPSSDSFDLSQLTITHRAHCHPRERPLRRPRRQVPDPHRRPCRSPDMGAVEESGLRRHHLALRLRRQLHLGMHRARVACLEPCFPPRPPAAEGADGVRCGMGIPRGYMQSSDSSSRLTPDT